MLRPISIMMIFSMITACSPIYRTEYAYNPPRSNMGKMCISQCVQNKTMNEQMCQMRNDNCRTQARQDAIYQYENYKREQKRQGKPVDKSVDYFENSFSCNNNCNVTPSFNSCYEACGGEVLEHQVCTAFCDKVAL